MSPTEDWKNMTRKTMILIGGGAAILIAAIIVVVMFSCGQGKEPELPQERPVVKDEPVPEPEPEPEPIVYPLTGLPASDESLTFTRPLSIKIENTPEARPQMGFGSADVVYESLTEGGITRFNCIFQSTIPEEVGPVRSGRNSDVTLVPQYDALFFMSGANRIVLGEIAAAGLADMSHNAASELYYRVDYRVAPHNLYLRLANVYEVAENKGFATTVEKPAALAFGPSPTEGAPSVTSLTVPFSDSYTAEWAWNSDDKVYYRSMDGPTIDVATDQQIAAANLVVLWVEHLPVANHYTLSIDMNTGGDVSVFFGGKRVDGTWSSDGTSPPRFVDQSGNPIELAPGKTWFQVLNTDTGITTS
jgi:hypothetical protein